MKIDRRLVVATAAAAVTLFSVSFAQAAEHHKMMLTGANGKEMTFDVIEMHGQRMILVPETMAPDVFHQMVFRFE